MGQFCTHTTSTKYTQLEAKPVFARSFPQFVSAFLTTTSPTDEQFLTGLFCKVFSFRSQRPDTMVFSSKSHLIPSECTNQNFGCLFSQNVHFHFLRFSKWLNRVCLFTHSCLPLPFSLCVSSKSSQPCFFRSSCCEVSAVKEWFHRSVTEIFRPSINSNQRVNCQVVLRPLFQHFLVWVDWL